MIGQLSHHALGQYDLPLPLDGDARRCCSSRATSTTFAEEWSLPADELRYALALREVVHGAQRSVPWVRERLVRLASDYVGAYEVQPDALEEQLGGLDSVRTRRRWQSLGGFGDPGALLGAMRSERQGPMLDELQRFVVGARGLHRRRRRDASANAW